MHPPSQTSPLRRAADLVGLGVIARECGVTYQALQKWQRAGRMPRTEWTGETSYSDRIEALTNGQVTRSQLLDKWPEPVPAEATT